MSDERKKFREALVEKKVTAFALFGAGHSPYSTADVLKVPRSTVRRWHKEWEIAHRDDEIKALKEELEGDRKWSEEFERLCASVDDFKGSFTLSPVPAVRTRDRLIVLLAYIAGSLIGGGVVGMAHDLWPWLMH